MHARLGVASALRFACAALFCSLRYTFGQTLKSESKMSSQEEELAPEILARRDEYFRRALHFLRFGTNDKSKWLIVHPTANLQRERNNFRAAQL